MLRSVELIHLESVPEHEAARITERVGLKQTVKTLVTLTAFFCTGSYRYLQI